jgi:anti-anti-sigma factor
VALRIERDDRNGVVRLIGELDVATVPRAAEALDAACASSTHVVVDLAELTFMDSSGVRVLLQHWSAQRERGADLVLRSPTRTVRRLLDLLGIPANGVTVEPGEAEP